MPPNAQGTESTVRQWDERAAYFGGPHYESTRGKVRLAVIEAQLSSALEDRDGALSIVDVGCGPGHLAVRLATRGHTVVAVDPSPRMRELCADRANLAGVEVDIVDADVGSARARLESCEFDVVLCHGVVMYIDSLEAAIGALVSLAKPSGVLSIVTRNLHTQAYRAAARGDWRGVVRSIRDRAPVEAVGTAHAIDDVQHALRQYGADPMRWFGVRTFSETLADEITDDPSDALIEAELLAAERYPFRDVSHLVHFIARRRTHDM